MKKVFFVILLLAFSLRYFGINWDQGQHLHPDERMIIMVVDRIHLPKTAAEWQSVLTPESPLNPKFFAYGSFPIYALKVVGVLFNSDNYGARLFIGRAISIAFELGTVVLVFLIAREISSKTKTQISNLPAMPTGRLAGKAGQVQSSKSKKRYCIWGFGNWDFICHLPACRRGRDFGIWIFPLLAMFFYAISILPIQSSHFFISDIPLTFLTTLVLYLTIKFINLGNIKNIFNTKYLMLNTFLGVSLGLSLATKITAIILVIPIVSAILIHYLRYHRIKPLLISVFFIFAFCILTFALFMPYAIIDFPTFKAQTLEQSRMRVDAFVFPFTLQYVNTTPYWYFVKNIILWGLGLPLGIITIMGSLYLFASWIYQLFKRAINKVTIPKYWDIISILMIFFIIYFAFMGKSAVKFMRYMLPIYPLLCVFGSVFIYQLIKKFKLISSITITIICLVTIIWPIAFISIYARPHTRIPASEWIYDNIPNGASVALEHWDDGLPLGMPHKNKIFNPIEFPLYGVDDISKWDSMIQKLQTTDYIIIASNRLYVPLMKLTDCNHLPKDRCYTVTARYYDKLFSHQLGYTKVAEFVSNPKIQIWGFRWEINDQLADESFTVYDHPKIMIFKNTERLTPEQLRKQILNAS